MSAEAVAADAATTNWRSYDGPVPEKFMFYVILFPLLMAAFLTVPALICYLSLAMGNRGRIMQYCPPNAMERGYSMLFPCRSPPLACAFGPRLMFLTSYRQASWRDESPLDGGEVTGIVDLQGNFCLYLKYRCLTCRHRGRGRSLPGRPKEEGGKG